MSYDNLYQIREETLNTISKEICNKYQIPYTKIPEVAMPGYIYSLENLQQVVPNSMLSSQYEPIDRYTMNNYYFNQLQIQELFSKGFPAPLLVSYPTSNKPILYFNLISYESHEMNKQCCLLTTIPNNVNYGIYVGNYI